MNLPITPLSDYGLIAPLAEETLAKLYQTLGPEGAEAVWAKACAVVGCAYEAHYTIDDLIVIAMTLKKTPGIAGVYGCSLEVRARSFRTLHTVRLTHEKSH